MRIPTWFVMTWVIGIGVIAVAAAALTYGFVRDRAAELDEVLDLPDPPQVGHPFSLGGDSPTATDLPPATPSGEEPGGAETPPAAEAMTPDAATPDSAPQDDEPVSAADDAPPVYQDPRRVSVLLMGIDQRQGETGVFVTDTMILFSMDPVGNTAAILSVPRDLWIEMPGLGRSARINSANIVGDEINYPGGGGPAYAVRVVEQVLGINKIDYYMLINFEVFTTLIDAIGPVEVCPPETIHDDQYPDGSYGYITVHFDPGCQDLNSERLLQYARVRHSDSDISRSSRQQEVILAVRQKVLTLGGVIDLLPQAVNLWESAQANIRTNMTFENLVSLARKAEQIPSENIRQGQITFGEVELSLTPDGDQVLIPIGTDVRLLVEDLFRPAGTPSRREQQAAEGGSQ